MMAFGQILKCFRHAAQNLNRVFSDGVDESADGLVQGWGKRLDCQTFESPYERVTETMQPVPVGDDALALDVVQNSAHLFGRIFMMVEERNKICDGAFKVNVVFPKRIVGIDEQRLGAIRIRTLGHNVTVMLVLIRGK
jgi:hypothetical protein